MLIYVAGKYTGNVQANIDKAEQIAGALWGMGHAVICPHSNSAHYEDKFPEVTWEAYLQGDFNMISRCDALVMVDNWKDSKGAKMEHEYALSLGIPVYYAPDLPGLHPTEVVSPIQCQGFREQVGIMYRTHLSKNADYSPANILLTGETGLVTRLWDKTARLLNLSGFKFQAMLHEGVFPPKKPKHESINDTYDDLAVYAVIGKLLRTNRWGR
jgi:hypothetical protein